MKKYSWILVLLMALVLGLVGCDSGGSSGDPVGPTEFELVLGDNFNYGHGYQTGTDGSPHINTSAYFKGSVVIGETYVIKFTVVADRDLEDALDFGFVDPSAAAGYWRKLTASYTAGPAEDKETEEPPEAWIEAGEEYEVEFDMLVIANPAGSGDDHSKLYFQTSGQCVLEDCLTNCDWTAGRKGEGLIGPVTLTFTNFTLARKGDTPPPCCEDCEEGCEDCAFGVCTVDTVCGEDCCLPPAELDWTGEKAVIKLGDTDTEIEVVVVGGGDVKYLGDETGYLAYSAGYGSAFVQFKTTIDLSLYASVDFTLTKVSGDTEYKTVGVAASATTLPNYISFENVGGTVIGVKGYSAMGEGVDITVPITGTTLPASGEVWIAICIHAGASEYIISNIVFVEKD